MLRHLPEQAIAVHFVQQTVCNGGMWIAPELMLVWEESIWEVIPVSLCGLTIISDEEEVAGLYLITVVIVDVLGQQNYHLLACLQGTWCFQIFALPKAHNPLFRFAVGFSEKQAFHSHQTLC